MSMVTYTVWYVLPYIEVRFQSADTVDLLSFSGYNAKVRVESWVFNVSHLVFLAASVLMYFFIAIGRSVFLWFYLFWLVLRVFMGVDIQTGLSGTLGSIIGLLDGAIIYMAYFSSVERYFGTDNV